MRKAKRSNIYDSREIREYNITFLQFKMASVCCTSLCLAVVGDEERATSMWGFHSEWKVELHERAMTERSKGRSSSGNRPEGCISMETLSEENTYMKEQTAAGLTCHEFVTRITRSVPLN